jgi:hypothetical protein
MSASFAAAAAAQQASGSSPSDRLDAFVGDGTCSGKFLGMGKHSGHATTAKFHGEKVLDGHWAVLHYEEDRTAANPKPYSVAQYIGYDGAKQRYVSVIFDNSGPGYSTGVSTGWTGKTITFDETVKMDTSSVHLRDVFTDAGSGLSSHTGLMRDKNGKWLTIDQETCHNP